jgi:hypothetical protein
MSKLTIRFPGDAPSSPVSVFVAINNLVAAVSGLFAEPFEDPSPEGFTMTRGDIASPSPGPG